MITKSGKVTITEENIVVAHFEFDCSDNKAPLEAVRKWIIEQLDKYLVEKDNE